MSELVGSCTRAVQVAETRLRSQVHPANYTGTLYRGPVYMLHSDAVRSSTRHGLQTVDGIDRCNSTLTATSR